MQTRRDRLQAYRFGTRRSVAALLDGDPDAPEAPLRRVSGAVLGGVLVAALVVAAAAVYGVLNPGGSRSWRDGSALIVEKETDTRYVYLNQVLHPVLNFASARLILGQTELKVDRVARASLGSVPRGLPVGIRSAPDALPAPDALISGPWTVCAEPAQTPAGTAVPYTRLLLGSGPDGRRPVPDGSALLVGDAAGTRYLAWNGMRFRIASALALSALGWSTSQTVTVGAPWLNALAAGPDLVPPAVPGRGAAGPAVAGTATRVGEVLLVSNVGTQSQYYVVLADGLSGITPLQAALLLGDPAARQAYPGGAVAPVPISAGAAAAAAHSADLGVPQGWPDRVPVLLDVAPGGTEVCAVDDDRTGSARTVGLYTGPAQALTADPATLVDPVAASALADSVAVPPAHGAVVRALPGPGIAGGTVYLVTDLGYKYALADAGLLPTLGYQGVTPVPVPAGILSDLPTGPELDTADATRTVAAGPAGIPG